MPDFFAQELIDGLKHETPYFVFSKAALKHKFQQFKKCFPGAAIHYEMKADAEEGLLRALYEDGAGFEAARCFTGVLDGGIVGGGDFGVEGQPGFDRGFADCGGAHGSGAGTGRIVRSWGDSFVPDYV